MDIKKLSEIELKVIAYDLVKNIQELNQQLLIVENEIMSRQRIANSIVENVKKTIKTK